MQVPIIPDASRPPAPTPSPPLPPGAAPMVPTPAPAFPVPTPVGAPVAAPYAQSQPTYPSTGTPDTAGSDLSKLLPSNGQGNVSTVLLAILAVAGGGAAWKFYSQRSKEKHEQHMKEIELRATANDQQRQKCDANAAANATAVKEVSAKVDDLARKTSDQATVIDNLNKRTAAVEEATIKASKVVARADDLEERLETVERKVRRAGKDES